MPSSKIWTLLEAKKILPKIINLTEYYYNQYIEIEERLTSILHEMEQERLEEKMEKIINLWVMQMIELQVEVKGLWLIDFDNGKGYYCWKYPEKDILYEHDYFSGFAGRKLILD